MNLHTQKGHIPENTVYVALQAVQMTLGVTEAIVDWHVLSATSNSFICQNNPVLDHSKHRVIPFIVEYTKTEKNPMLEIAWS